MRGEGFLCKAECDFKIFKVRAREEESQCAGGCVCACVCVCLREVKQSFVHNEVQV